MIENSFGLVQWFINKDTQDDLLQTSNDRHTEISLSSSGGAQWCGIALDLLIMK